MEQIDHMPPRMMFRLSQRPKGLEFPSCEACNKGTSRLDVVASFMARSFPGISKSDESQEWDKVVKEAERVAPGIIDEMWMTPDEMHIAMLSEGVSDRRFAAFRADGPILSSHMQAFAGKVGFALHYEATGCFVPMEGRVQVRWFTSSEVYRESLPPSLLSSIGEPSALKQGKINSIGIFEYGWGQFSERNEIPIYYARVRDAFVVAAFVATSEKDLPFAIGELATFAPGDLAGSPFDRIYY